MPSCQIQPASPASQPHIQVAVLSEKLHLSHRQNLNGLFTPNQWYPVRNNPVPSYRSLAISHIHTYLWPSDCPSTTPTLKSGTFVIEPSYFVPSPPSTTLPRTTQQHGHQYGGRWQGARALKALTSIRTYIDTNAWRVDWELDDMQAIGWGRRPETMRKGTFTAQISIALAEQRGMCCGSN